MKYKLINQSTNETHLCNKITLDGFDYYYIDELIPYNPKGGTNGNFICLGEIESNKDYGVKLGDKQYISPFVKNVGSCGGCRKLIATNNPNIDLPQVISELEDLANNHSVDDNVWSKESFIQGYNKSQETHPYSEQDLEAFYIWKDKNRWFDFSDGKWNYTFEQGTSIGKATYEKHYRKTTKELIQMWREQQPNIINIK